ncbi:MAG: hypothetical protein ACOYN0_08790 [Phycisphaerales bacterium]
MSEMPDKKKLIIGGAVVGVLLLVVLYLNFGGGDPKTPELSAAEQRAAEIQKAAEAQAATNPPDAPPELPKEGRPPRGVTPAK